MAGLAEHRGVDLDVPVHAEHDVAELEDQVDLRVIPPLCPLRVLPTDFSHGRELIERAHREANAWLDRFETRGVPENQAANLDFHRH